MDEPLLAQFKFDEAADVGGWITEYPDRFLDQLPSGAGALALVGARPVGRLRGASPILFIGRTQSLRGYFQPFCAAWNRSNFHEPTPDRLLQALTDGLFSEVGTVTAAWRRTQTLLDANVLRRDAIRAYESAHFELPPLNRSAPRTG